MSAVQNLKVSLIGRLLNCMHVLCNFQSVPRSVSFIVRSVFRRVNYWRLHCTQQLLFDHNILNNQMVRLYHKLEMSM